jgi:hypothetical protein
MNRKTFRKVYRQARKGDWSQASRFIMAAEACKASRRRYDALALPLSRHAERLTAAQNGPRYLLP